MLALACFPVLVIAATGLVLAPPVGRASDELWRGMASWHGYRLPRRRTDVDWRTWLCAAGQAILGALAFTVLFLGVALAGSLVWTIGYPDPISFFGWEVSGALAAAMLIALAVAALLIMTGVCWVLAVCSTQLWVNLTQSSLDVEDLTRSRAVLADGFSAERRRIERELHDGVQQYLTAVQLSIATARLAARDNEPALAALQTAQDNAKRAVAALRTTIRGIHPQVLDERGLTEAVRELVGLSGLRGHVHDEGLTQDQQLDSSAALLLYHAVAEACTNAVKHGGAHSLDVTIRWRALQTEVQIVNDGATPDLDAPGSGTGISSLRERAEMLGGGLRFEPREDAKGARLKVWVDRHHEDHRGVA